VLCIAFLLLFGEVFLEYIGLSEACGHCPQSECQQLICDILRATPDAASADAAVQTARLASKADPHMAKYDSSVYEGLKA